MSLPNFLYHQADLPRVCRHWPALVSEYHPQNTLYGHHLVYKRYAGLPEEEPLPWVIEHAISFEKPEPYFAHAQTCLPLIHAISEPQATLLRSRTSARVVPVGSAFFYMEKLFRQRHPGLLESGAERRGTLVFPSKSSKNEEHDFDSGGFARRLAELPDEFQPVVIAVFWRDFERGAHVEFENAGLPVVSAGNQEDPDFLFRYLDMCRHFRYSAANQLATSFCYSILSGCRFFYLQGGPVSITRNGETRTHASDPTLNLPGKLACAAASPFPPTGDGLEQRRLAERFAGLEWVRPPEFFREMLEEGRRLMRQRVPSSVVLEPVERLDPLAQWQPRGVDNDGWAQEDASFMVPHHADFKGVRLGLEVPFREDPEWEGEWAVHAGSAPPCWLRVRPGGLALEVPAPPPGDPIRVRLVSTDSVVLAREARRRSFRITAIEWVEALTEPHFSWGFRKSSEGYKTPVAAPRSLTLEERPLSPVERAAWLLEGVADNGRLAADARFTVPAADGQAGVRVKFSMRLPERSDALARISVTWQDEDGPSRRVTTAVSARSWHLEVPIRKDGKPQAVQLHFDSSSPSEWRLRQIHWRTSLAVAKTGVAGKKRLYTAEELKQLSSLPPPRPVTPPWWRQWWGRVTGNK